MDRFSLDTEDRDGLIADLTERLVRDWSRRLLAGDARSISDLHNCMLDRLTEADAAAVFVQAVQDEAGAAQRMQQLAAEAMRAECENEALKQIEKAEQALAEGRDADRIARAVERRVFA